MRLTKAELDDATGASDLHALCELALANKYIDDVGYLSKLTQLQELSLAFNDLKSLDGLAGCTKLRELNVMHNKLRSLGGLESMAELQVLKAAKNRVADLSALSGNAVLSELWVQQNRIADLAAAVNCLKGLPKLSKLVFKPNPCCNDDADARICRMYLLSQLPTLEFLDGQIANGERDDADAHLATDEGKAELQGLLERMAELVAAPPKKARPDSRGQVSRGKRPGSKGARDEEDEAPERARGSWSKSAATSHLNTRRRPKSKEGPTSQAPNRKQDGELDKPQRTRGKAGKEKRGGPKDEMKERRGGWGRGAVDGGGGSTFERRKKDAEKPATSPKKMERSVLPPSAAPSRASSRAVSRHERTSAEVAAGVEAATADDGGEEDPVLANAKAMLNGLQKVASRATTPAPLAVAVDIDGELEKENKPTVDIGAGGGDEEEEEEDPTLANAKRLLAGLAEAGVADRPVASPAGSAESVSPGGLVPTPPRSSGGRSSSSASSAKVLSPARSSCSGAGMSIMDAVAGLGDDPVPGTFLDSKRLFSNKRKPGSRNGRGGGRGGRKKGGPAPIPKEERMKRHSAPEKGTAPPEQQAAAGDAAGRPGTSSGLALPALPSAGGPQFLLRYTPKARPGQQRGPAASSRTLRLSRPRGTGDPADSPASDGSGASGPVGVVVRYDGSATAKYPNGNLAVSVDRDGFDDEGRPLFRLYAGFRKDGSVACSFDSAGNGFANFGTGSTCFTTNVDSGGFSMAADGGMEQAWSGSAGTKGGSDAEAAAGSGGAEAGAEAEAATVVVKQLDDHLLLRYSTDPAALTELFFKCGSVKHKFVLGSNPTMETWDPDDEFLYAEKTKKKKRSEQTFDAVLPLPSGPQEGKDYTNADQLSDIASLGAAMEQLTQALQANGV